MESDINQSAKKAIKVITMSKETLLSDRQEELWRLYEHEGLTYKECADDMDITPSTVQTYLSRIYEKRDKARATLEFLAENDEDLPDYEMSEVMDRVSDAEDIQDMIGGDDTRDLE